MVKTDRCHNTKVHMVPSENRKIALISECPEGSVETRIEEIVYCALVRSFGTCQIIKTTLPDAAQYSAVVAVNPGEDLLDLAGDKRKILALGALTPALQSTLGIKQMSRHRCWDKLWDIQPGKQYDASSGKVQYASDSQLLEAFSAHRRYLARYDFEREWNNQGYGAIERDDHVWGIS